MNYNFSAAQTLDPLIQWIREKMESIRGKHAVIGISGGKDSSVTAALMAKALGPEKVFGILMPDDHQKDISYAREIAVHLGIHWSEINIGPITGSFYQQLRDSSLFDHLDISQQTRLNLPPRVRMTLLYAISQSIEQSRVINTSNLSEDWVGYATIYGDTAGAFAPLGMFTTEEVIALGRELDIPEKFLLKPPADGLTGKTDEMVLGFSYQVLNDYLRRGIEPEPHIKELIDRKHRESRFKFEPIPMFQPRLPLYAKQEGGFYPSWE